MRNVDWLARFERRAVNKWRAIIFRGDCALEAAAQSRNRFRANAISRS